MERSWWSHFAEIRATIAEEDGVVVGTAGWTTHEEDGFGYILWLHAGERVDVLERLVRDCLANLEACEGVRAFWIATPMSLGLEGLPISRRRSTAAVLERNGFTGQDLWAYMGMPLDPATASDPSTLPEPGSRRLATRIDGRDVAEVDFEIGRDGIGVVWWLHVDPEHRRKGLGSSLFDAAIVAMTDARVRAVVLYVDDDDPVNRDRSAAIRLYRSRGFEDVDRLWSYERRTTRVPVLLGDASRWSSAPAV